MLLLRAVIITAPDYTLAKYRVSKKKEVVASGGAPKLPTLLDRRVVLGRFGKTSDAEKMRIALEEISRVRRLSISWHLLLPTHVHLSPLHCQGALLIRHPPKSAWSHIPAQQCTSEANRMPCLTIRSDPGPECCAAEGHESHQRVEESLFGD